MNTITFLLSICFIFPLSLPAQDSTICSLVKDYKDGTFLVNIKGKDYLAISEKIEKNMLKMRRDLIDAQKEIDLKDSLLASYENSKVLYDTTISRMKEYISELEGTYNDYKQLYKDLKKIKKPFYSFLFGAGCTGSNKKPSVMIGLRFLELHAWGFLQERNSGVIVGTQFQLFK